MYNSNKVYQDIKSNIQNQIDTSISDNLSTAGTVSSITSGSGISLSPSTITREGTISLNAELNDINGVSINTGDLASDQILAWNGTSWINKAFPGLSGTSFRFVDLLDVEITGGLINKKNDLIAINAAGTSVVTLTNNYINAVNPLAGIKRNVVNDNTISLEFDPSTVTVDNSITSTDHVVYHRTNVGAKRTALSNIHISDLNDDIGIITNNNLTAGTAITITQSGVSTTIGVCTSDLPLDFSAGVTGVLGLANGGTSGTTSASARDYLGLEYNRDILPVSGPSFTGLMYGDNISLLPSSFGLSLVTGGSGYTSGDTIILINPDNNEQINLGITFTTGAGGVITGPSHSSLSLRNLNLLDTIETYEVFGAPGSGASIKLTPDPFYLFFGGSTSNSALGLRDNQGVLEVKSGYTGGASVWRTIFPLGLDGLSDATITNPVDGDILIYEGTSFINAPLTGNSNFSASLTYNGVSAVLAIGALDDAIALTSIEGGVTKEEFETLSGVCTAIGLSVQIDRKIGVCPNGTQPAYGDLVYYLDTWEVLRNNGSSARKILGTSVDGSAPAYNYLYDYTDNVTGGIPDWNSETFVYVKNGESAKRVILSDFIKDNIVGTSGGLNVDVSNQLELDINNLNTVTGSASSNDLLLIYDYNASDERAITRTDFFNSVVANGISVSNDKIVLDSDGVSAISLKNYTNGSSLPLASNHQFSLASVGASPVFSNGTSWYYIPLGAVVT